MIDNDAPPISSFDHAIAETAMRYSGALGIGEPADAVEIEHRICIAYCIDPQRRRRGMRCPSCYGKVAIRDLYANEIEPAGTRFMWLAGAFLGGWASTWREATVGIVRKGERCSCSSAS